MSSQQLVKLSSVALGNACRLGYVPGGRLQQADQVIPLKLTACIIKCSQVFLFKITHHPAYR